MNLSDHFTLEEFTASQTAARYGISNYLPADLLRNAKACAAMLERIRSFLGYPLLITSGYRSLKLNSMLGSKSTSAHTEGFAADWHCPQAGTPMEISKALSAHVDELGIGQLINEFPGPGGWVHTSAKAVEPRHRIITINQAGTFPGIVGA